MSKRIPNLHATLVALTSLASCNPVQALADSENPAAGSPTTMTQIEAEHPQTAPVEAPPAEKALALPEPEFDLPELPYDKSQLSHVLRMDEMIKDAQRLSAAGEAFDGHCGELRKAADTSFNGTVEDQIKGILTVVDGFQRFTREGRPLAVQAMARFQKNYASDDAFASEFREVYSQAEEQLHEVIQDGPKRREVGASMGNTYRYRSSSNLGSLQYQLEEADTLLERSIERVLQSCQTDLMVADYKKGKGLTDLLLSTRSKLAALAPIAPKNQQIAATLAQVNEKEASRTAEIEAAREAYRFPQRYAGPDAPEQAGELEKAMGEVLAGQGYEVKAIHNASGWIAIRSLLGIHLYSQMDFYVAVPSKKVEGLLEVLYVTGKTGGPDLPAPFRGYSVGLIGEMWAKNL